MAGTAHEDNWKGIGDYPVDVADDGNVRPVPLTLLGAEDAQASADHMARVMARYIELKRAEAGDTILGRAQAIQGKAPTQHRLALIRAATKAPTTKGRIEWLRREADLVVQAAQAHAACHEGCSSCCHLAVALTEPEARLIARETGLPLKAAVDAQTVSIDVRDPAHLEEQSEAVAQWGEEQGRAWKGVPCPFLDASGGQGRCSVYKQSRPLACRHLINLDRDDLLCKLVDGVEVNVPYLARADAKALAIEVLGGAVRMADIRDWFGVDPVWRQVRPSR